MIGAHEAEPDSIWNDGFYVSACSRCGAELIRPRAGTWRRVPKNQRIVWKPKPADYPDWDSIAQRRDPVTGTDENGGRSHLRLVAAEAESAPQMPSFRDWRERNETHTRLARTRAC